MAKMTPQELDIYWNERRNLNKSFKDAQIFIKKKLDDQKPIFNELQSALEAKDESLKFGSENFLSEGKAENQNSRNFLVLLTIGAIAYYIYKRGMK